MFDYISENPQFIVNEFIHAGILRALDTTDNDNMMENADEANQGEVENYLDEAVIIQIAMIWVAVIKMMIHSEDEVE